MSGLERFEYAIRSEQLKDLSEDRRTTALDERDRELEDFLRRIINRLVPAGLIGATIGTTAPAGWLFDNQAIAGCDTLYPDLWAVAPAGWKSGIGTTNTLTIPNLTSRVLMFSTGTPGALAGSMAPVIGVNNLPLHTHAVGTLVTAGDSPGHVHYLGSGSGSVGGWTATGYTGGFDTDHVHYPFGATGSFLDNRAGGSAYMAASGAFGPYNAATQTSGQSANHGHGLSGYSTGAHQQHTHAISGATGNNTSTATALDTTPAHMTVRAIIKT